MEIKIIGAKENNLKDIDLNIPLNKLIVFTGLSGSGKSSLAFDTIHKEGQRRYLETFSSYARNFIGNFERPKIDHISGLSPVISIDQKKYSNNPRSTVGTTTEIYDYLRLLYAKVSTPISFETKRKMIKQTPKTILKNIHTDYHNQDIIVFAPIIKSRKGHYSELFQLLIKRGYLKVRVNNEIITLDPQLKLDRYKNHNIDILIDKLKITDDSMERLKNSMSIALEEGDGAIIIHDVINKKNKYFSQHFTCSSSGISYENPEPNSFSFNSPKGYCKTCKGLGKTEEIDVNKIVSDDSLSIQQGGIKALGIYKDSWIFKQIEIIGKKYQFDLKTKIRDIDNMGLNAILYGIKDSFKVKNKDLGITKTYNLDFKGIVNFIEEQYEYNKSKRVTRWAKEFFQEKKCKDCNGKKLKKESLYFLINKKNISEISDYDMNELYDWCTKSILKLDKSKQIIAEEILKELLKRVNFLINIGLNYITISRQTSSLSGGENQRIKIASQIGSELTNVLYILDEPSIGLHPVDNQLLINSLKELKNLGNSVIVVEHDKSIMEASDYIVDIGPEAGNQGGEIIFQGTYEEILLSHSLTGKYLSDNSMRKIKTDPRSGNGKKIVLKGASGNNLKNIDLQIPLSKLIVLTGVSGSGKSTLINGTLYPIISEKIYKSTTKPYRYTSIEGVEYIDKIININQSPIGRTPRSNPATYIGVFTDIRNLYANLKESKVRGYNASHFSFNLKLGTCKECDGNGNTLIQMKLLPDIEIKCKQCRGRKFNQETLEIKYNNKNIYDVLEMSIHEAESFFKKIPKIKNKLTALKEVGMGYIKLGQSAKKLSGGEAQRVKLGAELSKKSTGKTLYLLDEPTTGLHFHDIHILMKSINLLVDKGNTVIIIEHNLDIIKQADHIIDLGPNGGKNGGQIVFQGKLDEILDNKVSQTGFFLKKEIT
tara:strand:- start:1879 stop:4689 length:2811 start_codon:yes stop_codon:yes gene_type:complete